jgi:hypothetical protein
MTTTTVHAVSTTGINMLEKAAHAKFYRAAAPTVHFLQNRFHIALSHLPTYHGLAGVSFQVGRPLEGLRYDRRVQSWP